MVKLCRTAKAFQLTGVILRSVSINSLKPAIQNISIVFRRFCRYGSRRPDYKIELKAFHCSILNDHASIKEEEKSYRDIPILRKLDTSIVQRNYLQVKQDVQDIIQAEMERVLGDPALGHLVVRKG